MNDYLFFDYILIYSGLKFSGNAWERMGTHGNAWERSSHKYLKVIIILNSFYFLIFLIESKFFYYCIQKKNLQILNFTIIDRNIACEH